MKKLLFPLIAIAAGFGLAFLAAGVSSLFFIILPMAAFGLGYFSSWRWGVTCGLLLFAAYTFALTFIWWGPGSPNLLYPVPYIAAFIAGGFSLLLIGALAPLVRKGVKRPGSIAVLIVLAIFTGWAGYTAVPHYSHYYQVAIQSSQDLSNLELYLPVGTVAGETDTKLYSHVLDITGDTTDNFTQTIVDTEYGKMLKITIPTLKNDNVPMPRYSANIVYWESRGLWQKIVPFQLIQLAPKSDVMQVNTVTSQRFIGLVKVRESRITERFQVPVKISASSQAPVKLTLWNRTDRDQALNFIYTYRKSEPYTEKIDSELQTDGEWKLMPVEATSLMEIHGSID